MIRWHLREEISLKTQTEMEKEAEREENWYNRGRAGKIGIKQAKVITEGTNKLKEAQRT